MPLHVSPAPAPALRSVHTALGSPTAVRGIRTPAALCASQGPIRPDVALPVHEMARVARPSGTSSAPRSRLTGWRFTLRDTGADSATSSGEAGVAEAVLTADGWMFGQFCDGPYVLSTARALRQAQALSAHYQPRLLSVPELYMITLWLHGDLGADPSTGEPAPDDLLIPLAPAPPGIPAHEAHRVDRLLPLMTRRLVKAPLVSTPV